MKQLEFTEEELLLMFLLVGEVSDYMAKQVVNKPVNTWDLYVKLRQNANSLLINENTCGFIVKLKDDPREA